MGVVSSGQQCFSVEVQIYIYFALHNFGQDGLDTLTFIAAPECLQSTLH